MLDTTHILLHLVEGPINLGSACRAMANTGFSHLRFSGELDKDVVDARKFALHAQPILESARKCADLDSMIGDFDTVYAFTPRNPWEDGRGLSLDGFHASYRAAISTNKRVGLLFGNEARGLQNEHLVNCHYRVSLPTHSDYASMNLAQAVLVVLWEIAREVNGQLPAQAQADPDLAGPEARQLLQIKLRQFLEAMEFLNPQNPEALWAEVAPIFNNRDWTTRETNLLQAIFGKGRTRYLALQKNNQAEEPTA